MSGTEVQVDMVELIEEMAAFYVHVEVEDGLEPETLAQWREEIETQARAFCATTFSLPLEGVEIEVVLFDGSLWAKIKPKLATIALILSLYNGIHSAPQNLMNDWQKFADGAATITEMVTNGTVNRIEGPWKNSDVFYEFVQRINPSTSQDPQ